MIETRKAAVTAMSRKVADQLESIKQDYVAAANAVVRVNEALAKAEALRDAALSAMSPAAHSAAAAPTVPAASVQELASAAVRDFNDKVLGVIKETTAPQVLVAYQEYKKTVAAGVVPMCEAEHAMQVVVNQMEIQMQAMVAAITAGVLPVGQANSATPVAPVLAPTLTCSLAAQTAGAAAPVTPSGGQQEPAGNGALAAATRAVPREAGSGQRGHHARTQRPGCKVTALEESNAKAIHEAEDQMGQQRKATRSSLLAAGRLATEQNDLLGGSDDEVA